MPEFDRLCRLRLVPTGKLTPYLVSCHQQGCWLAQINDLEDKAARWAGKLDSQAIVQRYKSLADIERGFRVLKSEIELAPVYHRLPQLIRAHAMICFMTLILYRVMRQRLKMAQLTLSPEHALAQLKRIHRHRIKVNDRALHGVSTLTNDQADLLGALTLQTPTKHEQLSLL